MENNSVNNLKEKKSVDMSAFFLALGAIISFIMSNFIEAICSSFLISESYDDSQIWLNWGKTYLRDFLIFIPFVIFPLLFSFTAKSIAKKICFLFSNFFAYLFYFAFTKIAMALVMFIISSAYPDLSVYLLSTVNLGIDIFLSVLSIILAVVLYISISKSVEQTISKSGVVNGEASDCTDNEASVSSKSKTVAALLCFFLGSLGIHRFYAGKMGTGFLWLFTAGLGGVGAFIDFFLIIFGSFKDSNGNNLG